MVALLTNVIFALGFSFPQAPPPVAEAQLTPAAQSVQMRRGHFTVPMALSVCIEQPGSIRPERWHHAEAVDARLDFALQRLARVAHGAQGRVVYSCDAPSLSIAWSTPSAALPGVDDDEHYALTVRRSGAHVHAVSLFGVLHALQSAEALINWDQQGHARMPCVAMDDGPRFAWRGLLLDVARSYMPMPMIFRTLDAMALVKLNVFHWHLTDDQGFRIESVRHPELHRLGSNGQYYTQQQVREVIAYASRLGIRVVPEFDVPGHTASWLVAMPQLASGASPNRIPTRWGLLDDSLDPTQEATYQFLHEFFGEMAMLFPDDYLHIGGDEVSLSTWENTPHIRRFMHQNGMSGPRELHAYFTKRVAAILSGLGKQVVGWDEVLQPGLPHATVIQSWRNEDALAETLTLGHRALFSFGFYLDKSQSAASYYANDPIFAQANSERPFAHVLGGEACMWTELVGPENAERHIWPRAAAVAERLWSMPANADADAFAARLPELQRRLRMLGIDAQTSEVAQAQQYLGPSAQAQLSALLAYVEPHRENWWPGFTEQRLPSVSIDDFCTPDPIAARSAHAAVQTLLAPAGSAEAHRAQQVARQRLIALLRDARRAADAILSTPSPWHSRYGSTDDDTALTLQQQAIQVARAVQQAADAGLADLEPTGGGANDLLNITELETGPILKKLGVRVVFTQGLADLAARPTPSQ